MFTRRNLTIVTAASLLAATLPCSAQESGGKPVSSPGQIDTSRLVVAGGAITEILYALGLEKSIVAVDTTSQFPADALKTKKSVGYMRALSAEGVLSMNPSAILASDKAGPPEVVKALRNSAVPYIEIDDRPDPEALTARVRRVAALTGHQAAGEALIGSIDRDFQSLSEARSTISKPKRVLFILSLQNGRAMVGGKNTAAHAMFELAGAVNCAADVEGFKAVTDETLLEMNPDAIVIMTRSGPGSMLDEVRNLTGVRATTAGRSNQIIEMDALYLMGFGPRAPSAARDLMQALYPTIKAERRSEVK